MLRKLLVFVVVAVITYLVCVFVGGLLVALNVSVASYVGAFLKEFASVIAILAGLWYAFIGTLPIPL